jgi:hypothetical protein
MQKFKRFLIVSTTSIVIFASSEIMERYYGVNWFIAMPLITMAVLLIRNMLLPFDDEDL